MKTESGKREILPTIKPGEDIFVLFFLLLTVVRKCSVMVRKVSDTSDQNKKDVSLPS